ncbi:hypothetical protein J1N35_003119 [Gossypium stocksii]|uniref:Uncharacterized protein n=1 Tax=Gossypium stocksii TaxID=47602 RepID=A0A9D3WN56_9ROSI|nr:hypothetical protein J1N35_003119 [Gossypium stocksii]
MFCAADLYSLAIHAFVNLSNIVRCLFVSVIVSCNPCYSDLDMDMYPTLIGSISSAVCPPCLDVSDTGIKQNSESCNICDSGKRSLKRLGSLQLVLLQSKVDAEIYLRNEPCQ